MEMYLCKACGRLGHLEIFAVIECVYPELRCPECHSTDISTEPDVSSAREEKGNMNYHEKCGDCGGSITLGRICDDCWEHRGWLVKHGKGLPQARFRKIQRAMATRTGPPQGATSHLRPWQRCVWRIGLEILVGSQACEGIDTH